MCVLFSRLYTGLETGRPSKSNFTLRSFTYFRVYSVLLRNLNKIIIMTDYMRTGLPLISSK